jgi:hypothetical protein
MRARGEAAIFQKREDGTLRKVRVRRFLQYHRDSHSGSDDQIGNGGVACFDDVGDAHQKFAMVSPTDHVLDAVLNFVTEEAQVVGIDAAVHESEAVGRTDHCVTRDVEDRTPVDLDEIETTAEALPGSGEFVSTAVKMIFTVYSAARSLTVGAWRDPSFTNSEML